MRLVPVLAAALSAVALAGALRLGVRCGERVSQGGVRARVRCAGAAHSRAGRASNGLRRRAAGTRDPPPGGPANRVPRHSRPGRVRRRARASRPRLRSRLRAQPPVLRRVHVSDRPQHGGAIPVGRREGRAVEPQAFCWPSRIRTGTTTAATSRSVRTVVSTRASETADPEAIPRTGRRTCSRSSGSCWRSTSRGPPPAGRSRRSGFGIPGGSRSIARRAISTSATSARVRSRR